jgi:aspartate racemase
VEYQLGILGLGNRSTSYYLNNLNTQYNKKHGGYSTCPYLLLNTNFDTINPFLPHQFEKTIPALTSYIEQLFSLGAQHILIPNITLHETLDKIDKFDATLFIHPFQLLKKELQQRKEKPVVVLGTRHSMNNPYFNSLIENEGVEISKLENNDALMVDEFRTAIYNRSESTELANKFENLVSKLEEKYTIVVACTELSAYLNTSNKKLKNTIDLATLQIKEAIAIAQ